MSEEKVINNKERVKEDVGVVFYLCVSVSIMQVYVSISTVYTYMHNINTSDRNS